jgi:hypothetical protein
MLLARGSPHQVMDCRRVAGKAARPSPKPPTHGKPSVERSNGQTADCDGYEDWYKSATRLDYFDPE